MIPENYSGYVFFTAFLTGPAINNYAKQILSTALSRQGDDPSIMLLEIQENDDNGYIFDERGIDAVPCVVGYRDGKEWGRYVGFDKNQLIKFVEKSASMSMSVSVNDSMNLNMSMSVNDSVNTNNNISMNMNNNIIINDNNNINSDELKALVNSNKLMLFIKGTPEAPRCGFTGQLINILTTLNLHHPHHYSTFNILEDQRVREGLKKWSQWPTYPQIYWKGQLIGGLDILKEMVENGQMDEIVNELLNN